MKTYKAVRIVKVDGSELKYLMYRVEYFSCGWQYAAEVINHKLALMVKKFLQTPKTRKPANPSNLIRKGFAIDQFGKKVINHSYKKWNDPTRISIPDGWERVTSGLVKDNYAICDAMNINRIEPYKPGDQVVGVPRGFIAVKEDVIGTRISAWWLVIRRAKCPECGKSTGYGCFRCSPVKLPKKPHW